MRMRGCGQSVGRRVEGKGKRLTFQDQRSVRSNKHSHRSSSADRSCTSLGVDGDISSDDESVSSIPTTAFNPVDCVEESGRSTVASVLGVDSFDVGVARGGEEIHEMRLDRL